MAPVPRVVSQSLEHIHADLMDPKSLAGVGSAEVGSLR